MVQMKHVNKNEDVHLYFLESGRTSNFFFMHLAGGVKCAQVAEDGGGWD